MAGSGGVIGVGPAVPGPSNRKPIALKFTRKGIEK